MRASGFNCLGVSALDSLVCGRLESRLSLHATPGVTRIKVSNSHSVAFLFVWCVNKKDEIAQFQFRKICTPIFFSLKATHIVGVFGLGFLPKIRLGHPTGDKPNFSLTPRTRKRCDPSWYLSCSPDQHCSLQRW